MTTVLYFLGAADSHRIESPRPIQFNRADDEPHPYALVSQEEAEAIAADVSDLFAIKGALPGILTPSDNEPVTPPAPVTRRKSAKK